MKPLREHITDVMAKLMLEAGAKAISQLAPPADIIDAEPVRQPPPRHKVPPPTVGARPDPNLHAYPFPAPIELPQGPPPSLPAPNGQRPRGRPRKNAGNRPPLFESNGHSSEGETKDDDE